MFETPRERVVNTPSLLIAECVFVAAMTVELSTKVIARGLIFTPAALLAEFSGSVDLAIYFVRSPPASITFAYSSRLPLFLTSSGKHIFRFRYRIKSLIPIQETFFQRNL